MDPVAIILSIIVLILVIAGIGLVNKLATILEEPDKIQALADKLKKSGDALKNAVAANKPKP